MKIIKSEKFKDKEIEEKNSEEKEADLQEWPSLATEQEHKFPRTKKKKLIYQLGLIVPDNDLEN